MQGLKTGMYYLRTKPAANALQFTVDKSKLQNANSVASNQSINSEDNEEKPNNTSGNNWPHKESNEAIEIVFACSRDNEDGCAACGS